MEILRNTNPVAIGNALAPKAPKEGTSGKSKLDEKTAAAVKDFEGMLLAQMLQSIRESALGGWTEQSDQAGATALEMAEGQMARLMAANGGLGLAKVLERSLETSSATTSPK